MIGHPNKKAQNIDKPIAGCLGHMVNLFELRNGITGKKLLIDKPHCDGSSLYRSQADVARVLSAPDDIEDKMIAVEFRRCSLDKKAHGTPMKTLLAQEMSKEVESKHRSNVVAKLMGLDALPLQQPIQATQRGHLKGHLRRSLSHSGIELKCWEEDSFLDKGMQYEGHQCHDQNEFKNEYEIWQGSRRKHVRGSPPQKGMHKENIDEKKMALIRQKFKEAKCLATDSGCQSKEFIDAVEVLSSNRDLLLKFLDEPNSMFSQRPNSMFSQRPYHRESVSPPPETKRITVLRPSKLVDGGKYSEKKDDNQTRKPVQVGQATLCEKNNTGFSPIYSIERVDEYPSQPTRIVLLKPSPAKIHDIKAVVSPSSSPPRIFHGVDICEHEDDEAHESREGAKEITRQMCESVMGHRRDETLLSSVFSNGHIGDDAGSFNKSENGCAVGNLSDSEIMSPISRHSWDYINKFGSPYSSSCFSQALCSPESSVCREAKKRLSERWAMMTLRESHHEPKINRQSSSTLGEMLALSDVKRPVKSEEEGINKQQEPKDLTSKMNKDEGGAVSPKSLLRSKSLGVSSTEHNARLNIKVAGPEISKTEVPKERAKAKSMQSSLKGRVSGLFFSGSKKSSKEKSVTSQFQDESESSAPVTEGSPVPLPDKSGRDATQCTNNGSFEEYSSPGLPGSSINTNRDFLYVPKNKGFVSQERGLSVASLVMPGSISENHDHPSPISVLERLFDEDDGLILEPSCDIKPDHHGAEVSLKSNLVGKSPPIGSIARTLSWDDSCAEIATPCPLEPTLTSSGAEEEQDWLSFVQGLLSAAGHDGKAPFDPFFVRWHSPETPLDPWLRDKYANLNDKELVHEAKRRQRRSNWKLGFDSVNAAIMEITGCGLDRSARPTPCCGDPNNFLEGESPMLVDHVWAHIKEWFCSEVRCSVGDDGDSNGLAVERVVRKEIVGKGWDDMRVEADLLGKEIAGKLLEEIVLEAVVDLTDRA